MKHTTTMIIETKFGYNVQVSLPNYVVIGNSSDGVRAIAEREAEQQAREVIGDYTTTKKFISTL